MYRSIVVGTDDSKTAREAVKHAVTLAKAFDATLHIVSAFKGLSAAMALGSADAEAALAVDPDLLVRHEAAIGEGVEATLHACATEVRAEGVACKTHALPGDAAEAILDVAEKQRADLVVVGNRGMSGAKRFLLGSVPNKVAHHATCHVLIVHTT
jgi:nucleotide-binding universal stress UspA family protein